MHSDCAGLVSCSQRLLAQENHLTGCDIHREYRDVVGIMVGDEGHAAGGIERHRTWPATCVEQRSGDYAKSSVGLRNPEQGNIVRTLVGGKQVLAVGRKR